MADDDLVTIAKYGSPQDAQLTKSVLEGQGIRACVVDEATTGWLWYLGTALGGAKLQVARRDVEQAMVALRNARSDEGAWDAVGWSCPRCGAEVDAGFDVCWSCEAPREEPGADARIQAPARPHENFADVDQQDGGADEYDATSPAEADAMRAWRATMFGLFAPPLLLYAIYLIIKTMGQELSPGATRRYYGAVAICLVFTTAWVFGYALLIGP
jgi:hypothetical protein